MDGERAMVETKATRGYLAAEVDAAAEKLRDYLARKPDRRRLRAIEVMRQMEPEITTMKQRGYSAPEIVTALGECGLKISLNALTLQWSNLQKEKSSKKGSAAAAGHRPHERTPERKQRAGGAAHGATKRAEAKPPTQQAATSRDGAAG
jgi:hypothetical protein